MKIDFCNLRTPLDVLCLDDWVAKPRPEFRPTFVENYHEFEAVFSNAQMRFTPEHDLYLPEALITAAVRTVSSSESLHSITLKSGPLSCEEIFNRAIVVIQDWKMHCPGELERVEWEEEPKVPDDLDALAELDRWRNGSGRPLFIAETKHQPHPTINFFQLVIEPIPEEKSLFVMLIYAYWEKSKGELAH